MPLSEALQQLFNDVMQHCEKLEARNEALQREMSRLRPGEQQVVQKDTLRASEQQVQPLLQTKAEEDSNLDVTMEEKLEEYSPIASAKYPQVTETTINHNNLISLPNVVEESQRGPSSTKLSEFSTESISKRRTTERHLSDSAMPEFATNSMSLKRVKTRQGTNCNLGLPLGPDGKTVPKGRRAMFKSNMEKYKSDKLNRILAEYFSPTKFFLAPDPKETLTFSQRIEQGMLFKCACTFMILFNTFYIALDSHLEAINQFRRFEEPPLEPREIPVIMEVVGATFIIWFLLELLFKGWAERRDFFFGADKYWNLFDAFLVLWSIVEKYVLSSELNLSFMRIFRVFRLVRVVKVVRSISWLQNLRTMVFSVMNSFTSLMWAFCFIWLVLLVFGIIFVNGVIDYVKTATTEEEVVTAKEMKQYFGSLYETMVHLACSITGGNDWMLYGDLLRKLSDTDIFFWIYLFFIFFVLIGLMNVVTGIFVDSAVCTRTEDEVVAGFKDEQKRSQLEFIRIFKAADTDGSGTLTYDELQEHLEDSWVRAYFSGLDLDPSAAFSMFNLMDTSGDGSVDINEFVDGCLRLKGHARSIDIMSMMYDNAQFFEKFDFLSGQVQSMHDQIQTVLTTVQSQDRRHVQNLIGTAKVVIP